MIIPDTQTNATVLYALQNPICVDAVTRKADFKPGLQSDAAASSMHRVGNCIAETKLFTQAGRILGECADHGLKAALGRGAIAHD